MTLIDYLRALGRRWRWAALSYALVFAATIMVTAFSSELYSAKAEMLFSVTGGVTAAELSQGAVFGEQQMAAYKALVVSSVVLIPAINESSVALNPEQLSRNIRAEIITGTTIMTVEVLDSSPDRSALLANTIAETLGKTAEQLSPLLDNGRPLIKSTILIQAIPSSAPAIPNTRTNLILGQVAALTAALLVAMIVDAADPRFRSLSDVSRLKTGPVFPALPDWGSRNTQKNRTSDHRAFQEALYRVQSRLRVAPLPTAGAVCIVMSAKDGDGKTTVARELAASLSQTGLRVHLVHEALDSDGEPPASDTIRSLAKSPQHANNEDEPSLNLSHTGQGHTASSPLIGNRRPEMLISEMRRNNDIVILDSPSLLDDPEAVLSATRSDGVLFVIDMQNGRRKDVSIALDMLEVAKVPIVGIIPNRSKTVGAGLGLMVGRGSKTTKH